MDPISYY